MIVRDKTILSTGYNGSVRGLPHCDEVGHMIVDGHCVRTIHAEMNAIIQAAKNGTAIEGAGIYVTASPCWSCFKSIANAGVQRIVYGEFYRDERIFETARDLGIALVDRRVSEPRGLLGQRGGGLAGDDRLELVEAGSLGLVGGVIERAAAAPAGCGVHPGILVGAG